MCSTSLAELILCFEQKQITIFAKEFKTKYIRRMKQKVNMAQTPKNEKSQKDGQVRKQRVFNLIILDESGSMETIAKQAVSGLNETFQTIRNAQKEHQEQQHFITFVTFNSARIRTVMNRQAVDCDKKLKWTDYRPDECTPLFDAMGHSLNDLKYHVGNEDVVLVTIITDGYENASREFDGRSIKKLVAQLKEKGWVFAYIGTNQDVDAVADDMGIRSRMSYEYSDRGAEYMFDIESSSKKRFYDRLHREGRSFMTEACYDYFSPDEPKVEEAEGEPDIVWDVKDDDSSFSAKEENQKECKQTIVESNTQSVSTDTKGEADDDKKSIGLLQRIIKKLTLMLITFMIATTYLLLQR